ncbi:MAG: hypothetical protein EA365_04050 [Gloeocapsa sp. DLM2.Bin57]|nr:MAG: hypothetical protein EA365_04050 [Gloeocapsa sp. DLM2.Bin57]
MRKYFYIFLLLTLTACSQEVTWDCPPPPRLTQVRESIPVRNVTPIVYLDSTLSMQGFVNSQDSGYIQTLQLLDQVIFSISNQQPQYYRLGTTIQPLVGQTSAQAAINPNFYDPQEEDALLEVALNNHEPNSEELIIIVTELLRSNIDYTPIIDAFRSYLNEGKSIAIIGVRSDFSGLIFDGLLRHQLTGEFLNFQTDPDNLRPFYLVLIGNNEVIINYFEELNKRNNHLFNPENFLVINNQLVANIAQFNITENYQELAPGLTRVSEIYSQGFNLNITQKELVDLLQITSTSANQQYQYEAIPYYPLPYTLPFNTDYQITYCSDTTTELTNCQTNPNQSQLLAFPSPEITSNQIILTTQILDSNLSNHLEVINLDIIATELILPEWIEEWSYNESDRDQSATYLGTRTYKLETFLQNLLTSLNQDLQSNPELIARFCFAVQKQ